MEQTFLEFVSARKKAVIEMQEKDIEKYLVELVKNLGGWALKFVSPGVSGVPDRLILIPGGRMFFAELKRPGARPRPLQIAVHQRLRRLGFEVYVIDSKEKAEEVVSCAIRTSHLPADGD